MPPFELVASFVAQARTTQEPSNSSKESRRERTRSTKTFLSGDECDTAARRGRVYKQYSAASRWITTRSQSEQSLYTTIFYGCEVANQQTPRSRPKMWATMNLVRVDSLWAECRNRSCAMTREPLCYSEISLSLCRICGRTPKCGCEAISAKMGGRLYCSTQVLPRVLW